MNEIETKNALIAIAEALQAQMVYLSTLQNNMVALNEALVMEHPELDKNRQASLARTQVSDEAAALLRQVDSIIQWLKKKS
jgi:hypothetical protein